MSLSIDEAIKKVLSFLKSIPMAPATVKYYSCCCSHVRDYCQRNGFLNRFFFCVVKYKHDYFCDKSHLLLGRLSVKAELEQGSDKPPFDIVLGVLVDVSVFKGSKPDSLAVMPQNLVNGFRLSAGRPDNRFIRHKFRIPHGKAPPFLYAAFARHCVCDATPYFGSVRIVPRFPAVCNVRKSKDK